MRRRRFRRRRSAAASSGDAKERNRSVTMGGAGAWCSKCWDLVRVLRCVKKVGFDNAIEKFRRNTETVRN